MTCMESILCLVYLESAIFVGWNGRVYSQQLWAFLSKENPNGVYSFEAALYNALARNALDGGRTAFFRIHC